MSKRRAGLCLVTAIASAGALITAGVLAIVPWPASAVQPNIIITSVECSGNPEMVILGNQGSQPQDLSGWKLQSDPVSNQSYDLSTVGSLAAGTSVTIESGPAANGVFVWSRD